MRVIVELPSGGFRKGFLIGKHFFGGREVCVVKMEDSGEILTINARRVEEDPLEMERIASLLIAGTLGGIVVVVGIFLLSSIMEILSSIIGWVLR